MLNPDTLSYTFTETDMLSPKTAERLAREENEQYLASLGDDIVELGPNGLAPIPEEDVSWFFDDF